MGPKGTVEKARKYLKSLRLERFDLRSQAEFETVLDDITEELRRALPKSARRWGSSRKFLNIFLRGCCYNKYLCSHYRLAGIESWLEVPLDSQVAIGLKRIAGRGRLPQWPGVIHLTPELSRVFQAFATSLAQDDAVNRVDLDARFWRRVA